MGQKVLRSRTKYAGTGAGEGLPDQPPDSCCRSFAFGSRNRSDIAEGVVRLKERIADDASIDELQKFAAFS